MAGPSHRPPSPVALNPGQSSTQTLNFSVTTGQRNVDYPFVVSSPAPTIYTTDRDAGLSGRPAERAGL
ncbi:MAG: hypothetical protein M9927_08160 [Anaerolineae bacterium]|nr:hypothetical protein [Anaerolineae bacterium]